jgi:predicted Zn-dependent protease
VRSCYLAQNFQTDTKLLEKAQREYAAKKLADAERHFRALSKRSPSDIYLQIHLGQTMFEQQKFAEAAESYEKVLKLERGAIGLNRDRVHK